MPNKSVNLNLFDKIAFKMHPRVFAALGADLVTNDVVAVIELVKNSYDAFASSVWIRFKIDQNEKEYIEIEDDGLGMSKEIIESVWCVVATPYKEKNPFANNDKKKRRVAGEKGLGRLSVARLGDRLHMLTQAPNEPCWEAQVNWSDIADGDNLSNCYVHCRKYPGKSPFNKSGTRLQIFGLKDKWGVGRIIDLEDNLSRLISPFTNPTNFNIFFHSPQMGVSKEEVKIKPPEFLSKPKYSISGKVSREGKLSATYKFSPIKNGDERIKLLTFSWEQIYEQFTEKSLFSEKKSHCGQFSFEIRAWDIAPEDTQEIASRFNFQKSKIRKTIKMHKGISVYRDDILVLPKSENARDWLGLDLRRVSKVGSRMSTSQLVGYVDISADENKDIKDTSDRERLASSPATLEFIELLKIIISLLENERDIDRLSPDKGKPLADLFENLNANKLLLDVSEMTKEGAEIGDTIPIIRAFRDNFEVALKTIQEHFVHYSRLATVGTIAQMLVHEIRNRTTVFGHFMNFIRNRFGPFKDKDIEEEFRHTDDAVCSLERLADTFAPLASRNFRRRNRHSILEERINSCLSLQKGELKKKRVECSVPKGETPVSIDPGELDAVLLNLITNSLYWLGQQDCQRKIKFSFEPIENNTRVRVWIHDNGPGFSDEDREKVFWPGFTRKPGGLGMGLTVASELVAEYGGVMLSTSGVLGGASFAFDLPLRNQL